MLTRILLTLSLFTVSPIILNAQPYVDPIQVRYLHGLAASSSTPESFSHLWIGSDLPIGIDENSYLVISPAFEQWHFDFEEPASTDFSLKGFTLPIGITGPFRNSKWGYILIGSVRSNAEESFTDNAFQYGGAVLASFKRKEKQTFRFGLYANKEFFGWFLVPLLGIDWKINEKNYVFGVLPGRFTYEHKFSQKCYGGLTFRAPTNSYRLKTGEFIRVDDNQLSLFLDYYLLDKFCITLEPGFGVIRKLRFGFNNRDYHGENEWKDGPFIKVSAAYRIRL